MKIDPSVEFCANVPSAFQYRGHAQDGRRPPELIDDSTDCTSEVERDDSPSPPDAGETTHAHARASTCMHCGGYVGDGQRVCPKRPQFAGPRPLVQRCQAATLQDNTRLGRELAELERTNPEVAKAAADYDKMSAHIRANVKTPIDFDCPHCDAPIGESCRGTSWTHSVRAALCPDPDPKCAATLNWVTKARCKSRRSVHTGPDLDCPGDSGRVFQSATPRGTASFSEGEVELLDKLVRGALHGRSMEAAARHPEMPGLRAKVNGLSAQVARRHAERGD